MTGPLSTLTTYTDFLLIYHIKPVMHIELLKTSVLYVEEVLVYKTLITQSKVDGSGNIANGYTFVFVFFQALHELKLKMMIMGIATLPSMRRQ